LCPEISTQQSCFVAWSGAAGLVGPADVVGKFQT
jgi:hypothetical protein